MARYCTLAFTFPQIDGGTSTPSMAAMPRRPEMAISRPMITKAAQAQARPASTRTSNDPATSSLSAMVSRNPPRMVVIFQRRAR